MANKTVRNRQRLAVDLAVIYVLGDLPVGLHHVGQAPEGPGFCAQCTKSRGLKTFCPLVATQQN